MKNLILLMALFSAPVFATPVNINSADAKTISDSLTGIGIKKAEAIVADREQNGAFKSIEDLKRVSGIGEKTIAVNKNDILLEGAKPAAKTKKTARRVHSRKRNSRVKHKK